MTRGRDARRSRGIFKRAHGIASITILTVALTVHPARAGEQRQYDAIGRLIDVAFQNGGSNHYTYDANGNILSVVSSLAATSVEGESAPFAFALGRAAPNPGSGRRSIAFSIPARGHVSLHVFDVQGRVVSALYDRDLPPGRYVAWFDSDRWASGIYFYRLMSAGRVLTDRMAVLR